jgi:hypothetical protein
LPPVSDDTAMRLLDLYRHTDSTLASVLEDRIDLATLMPRDPGTVWQEDRRSEGPSG